MLASDTCLDRAFAWLCRRRRDWPDAADVWELRRCWPEEKERLGAELRAGTFRFGLLERIEREVGGEIEVFAARDALVLNALTVVLEGVLPVSRHCTHVKGHGGAKAAVRRAAVRLRRLPFVIRTDVRVWTGTRARVMGFTVRRPHQSRVKLAGQRELELRDPDGYWVTACQ